MCQIINYMKFKLGDRKFQIKNELQLNRNKQDSSINNWNSPSWYQTLLRIAYFTWARTKKETMSSCDSSCDLLVGAPAEEQEGEVTPLC